MWKAGKAFQLFFFSAREQENHDPQFHNDDSAPYGDALGNRRSLTLNRRDLTVDGLPKHGPDSVQKPQEL
jgi:hypothetical protein